MKEREESLKKKRLHGRFFEAIEEIRGNKSWEWLRKSRLKRGTEGMIMAAQEQALRTRNIRKEIDKEN